MSLVTAMARRRCSIATRLPAPSPRICCALDVPALIVPGRDKTHATSAARYLEECLPRAEYWDVAVADQTEETVPPRLLEFLEPHVVSGLAGRCEQLLDRHRPADDALLGACRMMASSIRRFGSMP